MKSSLTGCKLISPMTSLAIEANVLVFFQTCTLMGPLLMACCHIVDRFSDTSNFDAMVLLSGLRALPPTLANSRISGFTYCSENMNFGILPLDSGFWKVWNPSSLRAFPWSLWAFPETVKRIFGKRFKSVNAIYVDGTLISFFFSTSWIVGSCMDDLLPNSTYVIVVQ